MSLTAQSCLYKSGSSTLW